MGWRMSSLPATKYCGVAGSLIANSPESRIALQGSYFHALSEQDQDKMSEAKLRLSPEEIAEVESWEFPAGVRLYGKELHYRDAFKEVELELFVDGFSGELTAYPSEDDQPPLTVGHCDFYWVVQDRFGEDVVVVGDIKKSLFTSSTDSLQLHAYGVALCLKLNCKKFIPCIWGAKEAKLDVGSMVKEEEFKTEEIAHAATHNTGVATTGDHCQRCYVRHSCSAYLLPILDAGHWSSACARPLELTEEEATELWVKVQGAKTAAEAMEEQLRHWAIDHRLIVGGKQLTSTVKGESKGTPKYVFCWKKVKSG